ncbi:MAG: hypothetical protein JST84_05440 [Acidobacteria bacterium]|nr:hypothetical protein [Acidobacteriota bacterium]
MQFHQSYLLWQLAEEAAEVITALMTNESLINEATDFVAVVQMCQEAGILDTLPLETQNNHILHSLALTIQRASKAAHFGMIEIEPGQAYNNRERLTTAATDTYKQILIYADQQLIGAKRAKVQKYMRYAQKIAEQ